MEKKLKVFKELEYKKCPIYIRGIDNYFEYIVIYNNKLYSKYIFVTPAWYKFFLAEKYTDKQIEDIIKLLYSMATKTIDELVK